jgi:hypothetical protein
MLDTAGWVLYRQGKIEEAEPYLRSALAVTARGEDDLHLVVVLAKLRRLDEAAKLFAAVRTRPNFDLADSRETLRELTKAAGGDAELDALLDRAAAPLPEGLAQTKVIALVDGSGIVTGVETPERALPGVAEAAKSLKLPPSRGPAIPSVPSGPSSSSVSTAVGRLRCLISGQLRRPSPVESFPSRVSSSPAMLVRHPLREAAPPISSRTISGLANESGTRRGHGESGAGCSQTLKPAGSISPTSPVQLSALLFRTDLSFVFPIRVAWEGRGGPTWPAGTGRRAARIMHVGMRENAFAVKP